MGRLRIYIRVLACKMTNQSERRERHDEKNGEEDDAAMFELPAGRNFDAFEYPVSPEVQKYCRQSEIDNFHLFACQLIWVDANAGQSRCEPLLSQPLALPDSLPRPLLVGGRDLAGDRGHDRFQTFVESFHLVMDSSLSIQHRDHIGMCNVFRLAIHGSVAHAQQCR